MALGENTDKEFIGQLKQITLNHLDDERFGGRELALSMGMSWSTLNRKVQAITGKHISQIIREIRLEKALELLQQNNATAAEVAFKVGFGSPAYFSKCFTQCFGFPPGEVKKRMAEGTLPLPGEDLHNENLCPKERSIFSRCSGTGKPYLMAGSVALAVLFISIAIILIARKNKMTAHQGTQEKSIAVLPFKNYSSDPNNQYFADGINEEIINQLFRIGDLRVVSRTTADRFRDSEWSTPEIAKAIGVNYILEGSVRKQDDQVRITVQLIDGKNDHHLWTESYDRHIADIFLIQNEIAQNIAKELQAVITPLEKTLIEKAPTENIEAYDYYLLGNDYYWRGYDEQDYSIAISMYTKAIELDPEFAQACLRLAISQASMYWFHYDNQPERISKCKEAIDVAIRIDPGLPEIHLALGYYYYWGLLDYPKALEEFDLAATRLRNNPEIIMMKAAIYRRTGDWELARENFLHAFELEQGSPQISFNAAETSFLLGEYKEAEEYFNKAAQLNPTYCYNYWMKSLMYLKWKGNTLQARETMAEAMKFREAINNPMIIETRALLDLYDGHYEKAISLLQAKDVEIFENQFYFHLKPFLIAKAYHTMGELDSARKYHAVARNILETRIYENPDDSRLFSTLGKTYAGLGLKDRAIEAGKKGVELMPLEKEAYRGVYRLGDLARIYVMTGEHEEALKLLDELLSVPGPLSVKLLLLDPVWKPLWDLPGFKELADKYDRKISYS